VKSSCRACRQVTRGLSAEYGAATTAPVSARMAGDGHELIVDGIARGADLASAGRSRLQWHGSLEGAGPNAPEEEPGRTLAEQHKLPATEPQQLWLPRGALQLAPTGRSVVASASTSQNAHMRFLDTVASACDPRARRIALSVLNSRGARDVPGSATATFAGEGTRLALARLPAQPVTHAGGR